MRTDISRYALAAAAAAADVPSQGEGLRRFYRLPLFTAPCTVQGGLYINNWIIHAKGDIQATKGGQ